MIIFAFIGALLTFLLAEEITGLVIANIFISGIIGLLIADINSGINTITLTKYRTRYTMYDKQFTVEREEFMERESLRFYPLALFSSVMGFAAVTIATRQLELTYQINHTTSAVLLAFTSLWFLYNLLVFILRLVKFPRDIQQEFNHPIKMNFFAAISISFLLLAMSYIAIFEAFSFILWVIGALIQLSLTIIFLHKIMWNKDFDFNHFTPISFLPIVGNLVVPIAGSGHVHVQVNWFFFGFGILFSIVYLAFMFNRLFFRNQLPGKMLPTIYILLAPPAVAFVAYYQITGTIDSFGNILFGVALFIGLLLIMQIPKIFSFPFAIPSWAMLFPSGAMTIATIIMHRETDLAIYSLLNILQMIGLVIFVIYLSWNTIKAARSGMLFSPEE